MENDDLLQNASDKCFGGKWWHRVRPALWPGEPNPAAEDWPLGSRAAYSCCCSKPGAVIGRSPTQRRDPRFRFWTEVPQRFFKRLAQIPSCGTEGEQIQSASQMWPVSRSFPYLPQWKLERAGTVASDFFDGALGIIRVPAAVTVDQEGRTRVDRPAYNIPQSRSGVQLLQDRGCRPGHLLRPGQWIKYFRRLGKEVPGNADNSKAGAIELAGEKLNLRRGSAKKNRSTRLRRGPDHLKRHDRL